MYKVFIENRPIKFQINSDLSTTINVDKVWESIQDFLSSDAQEFTVEIPDESTFDQIFESYKRQRAAGGIVQRDNAYLFIKRNGLWDIPKGKLEKGEGPEEGAVREIEEECGLVAPKIKEHLLDTWHTFERKDRSILKRTYWYWLEEGEKAPLIPQEEEGITEVAYFKTDQFDQIKSNTYLSIIEVMEALEKKS